MVKKLKRQDCNYEEKKLVPEAIKLLLEATELAVEAAQRLQAAAKAS